MLFLLDEAAPLDELVVISLLLILQVVAVLEWILLHFFEEDEVLSSLSHFTYAIGAELEWLFFDTLDDLQSSGSIGAYLIGLDVAFEYAPLLLLLLSQ